MNSERLQLLVNELRRGEFIQGAGRLRQPGNHCALGVACEVFRRHTNRGRWVHVDGHFRFEVSGEARRRYHLGSGAMPTREVTRWYLDDPADPRLEGQLNLLFRTVAAQNDTGVPFEKLAGMIEAFLADEEGEALVAAC